MAVRINRGDPRRGAGPFAGLVTGDVTVETPNGMDYDPFSRAISTTIEEDSGGQVRAKGARSGTGKRTGTV